MGVESVRFEDWTYRRGRDRNREYTVTSIVRFSDQRIIPSLAELYTDSYGASFALYDDQGNLIDEDPNAYMLEKDCKIHNAREVAVTCHYTTDLSTQNRYENPLDRPPIATWGFSKKQVAYERDNQQALIKNPAGQVYEGLVRDRSYAQLSIIRNEASFSQSIASAYVDSVNASSLLGVGARCILCDNIASAPAETQVQDQTLYYRTNTYQFSFNPDSWDKVLLARGFKELKGGELKDIMVGDPKQPTSEPMNLKANGEKAGPSDTPYFETFKVFPEQDFSAFGFTYLA